MAASKVQGSFNRSASAATVTTPFTNTPTEGNLLIAWAKAAGVADILAISGWTKAISVQYGTSSGFGCIFLKIAGAGESKDVVLVATGSSNVALTIEEWTGLPSAVVDKTASTANSGGVTSKSSGTTAATTADEELAIAICALGNTITSPSWSNSFTDEVQNGTGDISLIGASKILSSTGTQETTASWTTSRVAGAAIVTFKAGTVATPIPVFMNQYRQRTT
jgi:hypothetical protein